MFQEEDFHPLEGWLLWENRISFFERLVCCSEYLKIPFKAEKANARAVIPIRISWVNYATTKLNVDAIPSIIVKILNDEVLT